MQMLCIAADADPIGYVTVGGRPMGATDLARQTGASEAEVRTLLDELDRNGVFSRDRKGCIYNRRMVRDARNAAKNQRNGKKGGNPRLLQPPDTIDENRGGLTQRITPKPEARSQKERSPPQSPLTSADVVEFEFGEFWKAYPRREDRGHALKAFRTARKKVDQATLMAGTRRYADMRRGQNAKYTALAATWLNGERWADEGAAEPQRNGGYVPMHPGAGG